MWLWCSPGSWGRGSLMALLCEPLRWPLYSSMIKSSTEEPGTEKKKSLFQQLLGTGRGKLWMLRTSECHLLASASVGYRSLVLQHSHENHGGEGLMNRRRLLSTNIIEMRRKSVQIWGGIGWVLLLLTAESLLTRWWENAPPATCSLYQVEHTYSIELKLRYL